MNILNSQLTLYEEKLLRDNFVVYHPETASTSQDFSNFKSKQVIFIGETHYVQSFREKQASLMNHFAQKNSCRLLESLAPGIVLNESQCNELKWTAHHIVHRGADIRGFKNPDDYLALDKYATRVGKAYADYIDAYNDRSGRVAKLLNELNEAKRITIKNSYLIVDRTAFDELRSICWDDLTEKRTQIRTELIALDNFAILTSLDRIEFVYLSQSNRGLAREIIKVSQRYEQIFAVWGLSHFADQNEIYERLKRHNITFIVLFPKTELNDDVSVNDAIGREGLKRHSLYIKLEDESSVKILDFTTEALEFLKLPLKQALSPYANDEKYIKLTPNDFLEAAKKEDVLQIEAEKTVYILGVNGETASLYDDALQRQVDYEKYLRDILNRYLFFSGVNITGINLCQESFPTVESIFYRLCLVFKTVVPLTFTLTTAQFSIDTKFFLDVLIKGAPPQYTLPKGKTLIFTDITADAMNACKNDIDLENLLLNYCPSRTRVMVTGKYSLVSARKAIFSADSDVTFSIQQVAAPILRKRDRS